MFEARANVITAAGRDRPAFARGAGRRRGTRFASVRGAVLAALTLLIVSLCYKIFALGVLVMLGLGLVIWRCRHSFRRIDAVFVLAICYVADATVTAFRVNTRLGEARTVQFVIIALTLLGFYAFAQAAKRADAEFLLKGVGLLCGLITVHLVVWHLLNHHLVTWKYLSDTKLIFSLGLIPLFGLEDWMRGKARLLFPAVLLTAFAIVLLSGERKALLLFCILFALCRSPIGVKIALVAAIALVTQIALLDDTGYIHRQLTSGAHSYSQASTRYFFSVSAIGDHSDVIREFVNRNAWRLFSHHRMFGIGANGYWTWAGRTFGPTGLSMNVHGEYHRVPVEGGLFGIAIALGFLGLALWRALRHVVRSGALRAPALDRVPLYCVMLLLSYCYAEALDTAMLLLIGGVGAIAGALPHGSLSLRAGSERLTRTRADARGRLRAPVLAGVARRRA